MQSTEQKIRDVVLAGGEGKVYFPSDFFDCGSDKAVSKALQRLVADEVLMRMYRGIYCRPTESRWGMGMLPASSDAVLEAIKKRDGIKTGPSSGEAQNALGLSDQVVMNPVYSTDGPSREIHYREGARPIVMYHVSPRVFTYKSRVVMLTVIALTDIGEKNLWEFDLDGLRRIYSKIPYASIREDIRDTPAWIRKLILKLT